MKSIAMTVLLAFFSACGGGSVPVVSDADPSSLPDPAPESAESDSAGEVSEPQDGGLDARDLPPEVSCGAPPFDPRCPCVHNEDCATGYCIATSEGFRCARSCTEGSECGPLEVCAQVATYPDILYLCVELYPTLCRPCQADVDCRVDFAPAQPKCSALGDLAQGRFCLAPCTASGTCPGGYSCALGGREGSGSCTPDNGECTCSPIAVAQQAKTICLLQNEFGTCTGTRTCSENGLGPCVGTPASAESCNGQDDDCDGQTDEGLPSDPCMVEGNSCPGISACENGQIVCKGTPAASESCNGKDDDCDGQIDEGFPDLDADQMADCVDPDLDGDGVPNAADNCPEIQNAGQEDLDGDGQGDACDIDDDGDGVVDGVDNCLSVPNTNQADADGDGAGDACDCDADGDGVANLAPGCPVPIVLDDCPFIPDPNQSDVDEDGIGDACDADADNDGVLNLADNCPLFPNPFQEDLDHDGKGDPCDADDDNDSVLDSQDNCPFGFNPDQADLDNDGLGDACDADRDGDEVLNDADNCPGTFNPDQADADENGVGDACEADWDGDGVANGDDNCPHVSNPFQEDADSDTVGDACDCDQDDDGVGNPGPGCPVVDPPDNCPLMANPVQEDLDADGIGDACDPDRDGDGEADATDCRPEDSAIHHGAEEVCNGTDDNCNGQTDEGPAIGCAIRYLDADGDGFGVTGSAVCRCGPEGLYTASDPGDCDDADAEVSPGRTETCDDRDDDCDGQTDEPGAIGCVMYAYDGDGDGHGIPEGARCLCKPIAPYSATVADDCADADGNTYPGAAERCDGADNDCDGEIDEEDAVGCQVWYQDLDDDGYGDTASGRCLCGKTGSWTATLGQDCDDGDANVRPGVAESCNDRDDDCNGQTDEGSAKGCSVHYRDADHDGHGKAGDSRCRCGPEDDYTSKVSDDCDDTNAAVFPGAVEACNGKDDDCDGQTDEGAAVGCKMFYLDGDGDGFGAVGTCLCAAAPPYQVTQGGDCDDTKAFVNPAAVEVCDTLDNDCDGVTDEEDAQGCFTYYQDGDKDTWGAKGSGKCLCGPTGAWTAFTGGDCDDTKASVFPGAATACSSAANCCAPADTCISGTCAKGAGSCKSDADCPGDNHCVGTVCVPWGIGPGGTSNTGCNRPTQPGIFRPALQCKWSGPPAGDKYPTANNVIPTPVVVDFDFDGDPKKIRPSIVFPSNSGTACDDPNDFRNGWIRIIDGETCAQQYTIDAHEVVAATPVAVGDLDLDGRPEIVANAANGGLVAFKFDKTANKWNLLWHSTNANGTPSTIAASNYRWNGPTIGDVDNDGKPEVLLAGNLHNSSGVLLAADPVSWTPNTGYIPVVADVDQDKKAELVRGSGIWEYKAGTGWVKESYFTTAQADGHVALADFGDWAVSGLGTAGLPEIVVVSSGQARIQTLSGQIVFGPFDIPFWPPATSKGNGGPPTVGDFDGDGKPEFALAGTGSYTVFDRDCNATPVPYGCLAQGILWSVPSKDYSSSMTGSSVFDFEGDGRAEAIYADECYVRIYSGNTGEVLFSQARSSGTWYENPIVADVDGDFRAEMVVGTDVNCSVSCAVMNPDPYFRGLKCAADADCPTGAAGSCKAGYCRCASDADCQTGGIGFTCLDPIPNTPGTGKVCRTKHQGLQAGLFVFKDAADAWVGSRPIWNQHAYSVTNVNDDGTIPASGAVKANWKTAGLNNFRQNVQGSLEPTLAADLTASLGTLGNCDTSGVLSVPALVCNRGAAPVAAGLAVAFTNGSPIAGGEVVCLKKTTLDLHPGQCETLTCGFKPGGGAITVGVYADYGGAKGEATECREDNNWAVQTGVTCRNLE